MAKKIIQKNEEDLSNIIKDVLSETIDELTLQQASVGGVYNTLAMDDINNGNPNVTFGSKGKPSVDRLRKSNDIEWKLLSKAIVDLMGNFNLHFVQPDGGIGNKVIDLCFSSILSLGNNGFIMYGRGRVSGKTVRNGKEIDNFKSIKIFYDNNTKQYSWINTYHVNSEKYIKATSQKRLILPKGNGNEMLENMQNEQQLFSNINQYIDLVNSRLPESLQLTIRL